MEIADFSAISRRGEATSSCNAVFLVFRSGDKESNGNNEEHNSTAVAAVGHDEAKQRLVGNEQANDIGNHSHGAAEQLILLGRVFLGEEADGVPQQRAVGRINGQQNDDGENGTNRTKDMVGKDQVGNRSNRGLGDVAQMVQTHQHGHVGVEESADKKNKNEAAELVLLVVVTKSGNEVGAQQE